MHSPSNTPWIWRRAILAVPLSAGFALAAPSGAQAGFLDFLFGGFQQRQAPPANVSSYAEPSAPLVAPRSSENVRQGGGGNGRFIAFCVRLCDGQHFPVERTANATPIEACRSMCPASKTKVFFGSEIDHAVARDGEHYAALDAAYVYRDHVVPNCTCNGKNAFGLAPVDAKSDPTLRPGDIVSTENGLVAYTGRRSGQAAAFTPVHLSVDSADTVVKPPRARLGRRDMEPATTNEQPGQITGSHADMRTALRTQDPR